MGFVRLNFDGHFLGNFGQLEIEALLRDHFGIVVRAFSKPASQGSVIEAEILAALEGYCW